MVVPGSIPNMILSFDNFVYHLKFKVQSFLFLCKMISISHKTKHYLTFITKVLIVCLAFYVIYDKLAQNEQMSWSQFQHILQHKFTLGWVMFMLFLSFLNRFLEILKWQNLVSIIEPISLKTASKQVLAALTAGLFTPNGIGEYAGKALYFSKTKTKKIIFLNLICNGIQMLLTVFFGLIGLLYLGYFYWVSLLIGLIILLILFFTLTKNVKIKGYSFSVLISKITDIPKKNHQKNIYLAIGRYLTISHQYYFLLILFGVKLPYLTVITTIIAVYFIASSLPSFQFLDFAVKGGVALWFFDKIDVDEIVILFITTFMWFFNVVLPVIIGSYFVFTFKNKLKNNLFI